MNERTRWAIDVTGMRFQLVERLDSAIPDGQECAKLFAGDGEPLIDEGYGFFRHPFGGRYKLVD